MPHSTSPVPTVVTCESEPIHIPGAVQPFAVLLSVELSNYCITNVSANCVDVFGIGHEQLLHRSLVELMEADDFRALQAYLLTEHLQDAAPLVVSLQNTDKEEAYRWEVSAHYIESLLILELEPLSSETGATYSFQREVRGVVQALLTSSGLQDLCDQAVTQTRRMTGFDRVKMYRFTEEWHGEVIAEARAPHMHSFLHHWFPASDIPAQARAVFLKNWLRMIPDVHYAPVPIHPGINPATGAPLDLFLSAARSVSPIHIEYLKNLEVGATLTLPLINEGKLWGLISCHHATPRKITTDTRLAVKMLAQLVSSQLGLKQSLEDFRYKGELTKIHDRLLKLMEQEENIVRGLIKHSPNMLDIAGASGAAAAIYYNSEWTVIGATPTIGQIEELVDWLVKTHGHQEVFATQHLSKQLPSAKEYADVASGLLAISIPKSERNYILWFRPQVSTTIVWAGEPQKRLEIDGDHIRLHPRLSFDSWKEITSGLAKPWKKVEIDAITDLRSSILAIDLRQAYLKEKAARATSERVSAEKQDVVHMVSHDIRNPLSVIKMSLQMMQMENPGVREMVPQLVARSLKATAVIERLVTSILDQAKQDNAFVVQQLHVENAQSLVHDAVELATPLAERAGLRIVTALDAVPLQVKCQRSRIEQVLGNLISNALKFTNAGGRISLSVRMISGEVVISVEDTGIGIEPHLLPRVFDRFVQGEVGADGGAGLGLSIVKSIIEQEGGRVWVDSVPGAGTTFSFTLPSA